ncbi:MAG: TonB-dependent receptor [Verrucomicrobia bacterium]|nr:TonB-dependent receptor [Verrucomicrobiota bacterium]
MHHPPTRLCLLLAGLLSLSAQAQTTPASPAAVDRASVTVTKPEAKEEVIQQEKVVVTSFKRALEAYKVPINVSVLTEDALREYNITDIKRLMAESEAINAPLSGARFADNVTVRGLNTGNANANNLEQFVRSTLSYYLDDTPLPNIGFRIKDVARAETLIGPQGTLYGAGSLGGTIRYITNQPRFGKLEGRISGTVSETKHGGLSFDADTVVNVPLTPNLALRVSLSHLDEAGFTDRVVSRPWAPTPAWIGTPNAGQQRYEEDDWQRVTGGRATLRWKATPTLTLSVSHAEQAQDAHGTSGTQLFPIARNPEPGAPTPLATRQVFNEHTIISPNEEYADRRIRMDSLELDWDLGFARLVSSTGDYTDRKLGQADYTAAGNTYYNYISPQLNINNAAFNGRPAFITFDNYHRGLVHETRLSSKDAAGPVSWITGLFYTKTRRSLRFSEYVPGLDLAGARFVVADPTRRNNEGYRENQQTDYQERALFGEANFRFSRLWNVTAGLRSFSYEDDGLSNIRDYTGPTSRLTERTESQKGRTYFKLNSSYQFSDQLLGYATFSQGYRRGGANGFRDYAGKVVSPQARAYEPDSVNNFEGGLKGYLLKGDLYVQTAVYEMRWKNPQVGFSQTIDDLFPINGLVNGGNIRSRGLEAAFRYRINRQWSINYKTSTTSARFIERRVVPLYTVPSGEDLITTAGLSTWGAPKWKHFAGLRFSTPLREGLQLTASLRLRRVDKLQWSSATNNLYPAYTKYDANVGLYRDKWDLSLWVDNLTNNRALVSNNAGTSQSGQLGSRAIYLPPITIGTTVSYRW